MKRYLVTVQYDNQQEESVIIADSLKSMRRLIDKLYNCGNTEIVSYLERDLP